MNWVRNDRKYAEEHTSKELAMAKEYFEKVWNPQVGDKIVIGDPFEEERWLKKGKEYPIYHIDYNNSTRWLKIDLGGGGSWWVSFTQIMVGECYSCKYDCKRMEKCEFYEERSK